jgi:hypothetical protein
MAPGAVVREAWGLYTAHWKHLVAVSFVVYLAISAISLALAFLIGIFALFVTLAGIFWLQGVLVKAVDDVRDGRADLSIRETLESALPRINVLSATGLLAAFAIGLGLAFFVVPGLILLTIWSLVVPAIMFENAGVFRAFGRSQELVRGNGWNVFTVILMTFALLLGAGLVARFVLSAIDQGWVASLIADIVVNSLVAPFVAVTWTLMYYALRARGPSPA